MVLNKTIDVYRLPLTIVDLLNPAEGDCQRLGLFPELEKDTARQRVQVGNRPGRSSNLVEMFGSMPIGYPLDLKDPSSHALLSTRAARYGMIYRTSTLIRFGVHF